MTKTYFQAAFERAEAAALASGQYRYPYQAADAARVVAFGEALNKAPVAELIADRDAEVAARDSELQSNDSYFATGRDLRGEKIAALNRAIAARGNAEVVEAVEAAEGVL